MSTFACYTDISDYLTNATASTETTSLLGLNAQLTNPVSAGATSFSVTLLSGSSSPSGTFQAWFLDGLNGEVIACSLSGTTVTLAAGTTLSSAHGAGVSVSSAGTVGCLAQTLVNASRLVDSICNQGAQGAVERTLFAQSRTETLNLGTKRAHIDPAWTLYLAPYHFPVQSVANVTIQTNTVSGIAVSNAGLTLPEGAKRIAIPTVSPSGASGLLLSYPTYLRDTNNWVTLTYTGGPITGATVASVPYDIRQATWWCVGHLLGYRLNPGGAAMIRQGDTMREFRLRGDKSNKSLLLLDATQLLAPYTAM